MSKMFVHYSGTIDQFKALNNIADYDNKIVFIKGGADGKGAAIYTHGNYYANLNEALAGLKYISSVKAGGVTATAQGPNGVIEFSAADPTTVSVAAGSTGVTIGLTEDFKKSVSDNTAGVAANAQAIIDEASARGTAINTAKNELTAEINKKADSATMTEELNKKADSSVVTGVDDRVKAIEADYLKAANIAGKLDTSVYEAKVAELAKADTDNLKAAKDYADAEIAKLNSATVAAQVEANKTAIATLNGSDAGMSARAIVQDEVTKQLTSENITESFDTLKEMAEWLSSHPQDVTDMQNAIKAISDDYLKAADKEEIQGIITENERVTAEAYTNLDGRVIALEGKNATIDSALQAADIVSGSANGTISVKGADVAVTGLASAAYTEASAYATAAQGAKADAAAPADSVYTKTEVDAFWAWEEL
jgi:hypothetical protein